MLVVARRVPVVKPVEIFILDPEAFVSIILVIVELDAESAPVEMLVVAKIVPVVIPDDILADPLTSRV